ncbi:hypothetical protein [Aeromonas veronii]|uniref:hypothetical protein n=1 Tax=Aeromonas veronii TaxID=654 RepID=UPI00343ADA0F
MRDTFLYAYALLMLSGCTAYNNTVDELSESTYRMYAAKPLYEIDSGAATLKPGLLKAIMKTNSQDGIIDGVCFTSTDNNKELCKQQRNIAISALMLTSEEICIKHRRSIYGNEASSNLILGSLTNIFSGAATVVSPTTTKSIFSALSLFTNAERSLVNESIYKQMMVSSIDNKIVSKREELASAISAKMNMPVDAYSVAEAMYDATKFHSRCSFMEGLRFALIEGEGNASAQKADALRREITDIEMKMVLFKEDNKVTSILSERLKKLYEMLNELGVDSLGGKSSASQKPGPKG